MGFPSRNSTDSQSEDMRKAPFWLWLGKKKRSHYNTPEASPMTKSSSLGKKPYHWNIYPTWGKGIAPTLIPAGSSFPIKLKKKDKTKHSRGDRVSRKWIGNAAAREGSRGQSGEEAMSPERHRNTCKGHIPEIWTH